MDILVVIVDSLRASSVPGLGRTGETASAPFLESLPRIATSFSRAFATECWTLPTHLSVFTGLLPSQHGAHFQHMGYAGVAPTIAELASQNGYVTELATRNPVLDGSLPGVTRGFQTRTAIYSPRTSGINPLSVLLAASKPRFRRQIATSGFFAPIQRASRQFVTDFARSTAPADQELLDHLVARMRSHRAAGRRFLLCANLFDVHAPYPPTRSSIFRSWRQRRNWEENFTMPFVLPLLGSHQYLRPGFRLRERSRQLLLGRYHDAIALADQNLSAFWDELRTRSLLDDLLLIVMSDHGEAFGEHGLYLHDASVYQTHLHVPLFVHHPAVSPSTISDVVSTRDLFTLMHRAGVGRTLDGAMLDAHHRATHPLAFAEHVYYPHAAGMDERFRQYQRTVIAGMHKVVRRGDVLSAHDLETDAEERRPRTLSVDELRGSGLLSGDALRWLLASNGAAAAA